MNHCKISLIWNQMLIDSNCKLETEEFEYIFTKNWYNEENIII